MSPSSERIPAWMSMEMGFNPNLGKTSADELPTSRHQATVAQPPTMSLVAIRIGDHPLAGNINPQLHRHTHDSFTF